MRSTYASKLPSHISSSPEIRTTQIASQIEDVDVTDQPQPLEELQHSEQVGWGWSGESPCATVWYGWLPAHLMVGGWMYRGNMFLIII